MSQLNEEIAKMRALRNNSRFDRPAGANRRVRGLLVLLSIIFGGFLIKPAPICILDEADAPLDDSNTDKFARMLRELSGDIQFIVITHNRTTMESADYIYGITMEEPGASKVISMQLAEV